ncbi:hypothetical protein PQR42_33265, partial [Paraburkholderia sediminicola]
AVCAEMSRISPVFLFPGALGSRAEAIGNAFAESLTLGSSRPTAAPQRNVAKVRSARRSGRWASARRSGRQYLIESNWSSVAN